MSNRSLRVNELILRELSHILRQKYRDEASMITLTGVEVTPDVSAGKVFVAVTGDEEFVKNRMSWLRKHAPELRFALCKTIILRHMPVLTYVVDTTTDRGNRILSLLDEVEPAAGDRKDATDESKS